MWRNSLQADEMTRWEQQDLCVQVDQNLRRAYPARPADDLPDPIRRALRNLKRRISQDG